MAPGVKGIEDSKSVVDHVFNKLFHPKSIVVVGASNDEFKPGGRVTKNIIDHNYAGTLWAINPKSPSIMDLPTYPSIDELPECPELAIIAIPAPLVAGAMEDLGRKGVKVVVVLSAGFSETDEKGKKEEERLLDIADRANMTLIGPNCVGILTPTYVGKFAGINPTLRERSVDFISCSGATVDQLMEQATNRGLTFCNIVTTGNSAQMGVEDILAMVDENYGPGNSRVLLLYMESIKKPQKLLHHARSLHDKGCTVVGVKSGVTEDGERAAASHTGAIATNDRVVEALFEKAGIIRVKSKMELIDMACVLSAIRGDLKGNRVCILTDAGGPGVMLSDECNRQGLELPVLGQRTQERLKGVLPPESPVGNPV
ncbi:MAG: CoA-binding protein, partial [Deltaproteobacteria bacterium]|nr:CoA-binding protein [Deltaproteobacteria bacterium]